MSSRGIKQHDLNAQLVQRREQAQHAAGNELDARQIEGEHFDFVIADDAGQFVPALGHVDMIQHIVPAEADNREFARLVNVQVVGFVRGHA